MITDLTIELTTNMNMIVNISLQALIYPLTVASKSNVVARQMAANKILKSMREHSHMLVQQAMLVSSTFISLLKLNLYIMTIYQDHFCMLFNKVIFNRFDRNS